MIREPSLRWKYQGVWLAKIDGVDTRVVMAHGVCGRTPVYDMALYLDRHPVRAQVAARGMAKWIREHKARRIHR